MGTGLMSMRITMIIAVLLFSGLHNVTAAEIDRISASLKPSYTQGYYTPNEVLHIVLEGNIPDEIARSLSVELDGIDITAMSQRGTQSVKFVPVKRLEPGQHELRLMHYGADGSVAELGLWLFQVRQSSGFQRSQLGGHFEINANQRVAQHNRNLGPDTISHGAGQIKTSVVHDQWQLEGAANFSYIDDTPQSLTGRHADIPNFSITTTIGKSSLTLGDQQFDNVNFLSDGYQRRGITASVAADSVNSVLSVYSASANQRIGLDGGLGVSDSDNRVSGAKWYFQPLNNEETIVLFSTSYLTGAKRQADFATVDFTPLNENAVNDGEGWNISMDSQLFKRQLRLRLEKAKSVYDFDGRDFGFEPESDDAWSTLIHYQPLTNPDRLIPLAWGAGIEIKQVGTFYKSLSNNNLPADKKLERFFTEFAIGNWNWSASLATEKNNLENNPDYAITETTQAMVRGGYNQTSPSTIPIVKMLFGQPHYSWTIIHTDMEDEYTPDGYISNNLSTRSLATNASFTHTTWQWSIGYNHDDLRDFSKWQPDTRTRAIVLNANMQLSKFTIGAGWQNQETLYRVEDITTRRHLFSLDARTEFIPQRLFAGVSVAINDTDATDDPFTATKESSIFTNANIQWRIKEATANRAGLDLALVVTQDQYSNELNPLEDDSGYQIFIKLSTSLPVALPGAAK